MWATTLTGNGLYNFIYTTFLFVLIWGMVQMALFHLQFKIPHCDFSMWRCWFIHPEGLSSTSKVRDLTINDLFFFPVDFLTKSRVTKKLIWVWVYNSSSFFHGNFLSIEFTGNSIHHLLTTCCFFFYFFKSWWEFVIGNLKTNLSWKPNSKPIMWGWLKWHP